MSTQELIARETQSVELEAQSFMPVFNIRTAIERRNALVDFTQQIMVEGVDYGKIPGSAKSCLLKAGAEKLCTFFGLVSEFILEKQIEDWDGSQHGGEPLFYYRYKCRLSRGGRPLGEGDGSCNSWEAKYRYRWVDEAYVLTNGLDRANLLKRGGTVSEFTFAVDKAETAGKYGKPAEYWQRFKEAIANGTARSIKKKLKDGSEKEAWEIDATQYRIPNPDAADIINTCQKMSQKRALVAACLIGVNASEYFTQDIDELEQLEDGPPPPLPVVSKAAGKPRTIDVQPANNGANHAEESAPRPVEIDANYPPEVVKMLPRMATKDGWVELFGELRDDLSRVIGNEKQGLEQYQTILGTHSAAFATDFKSRRRANACVLALWQKAREIEKAMTPMREPGDDMPQDMFGQEG